MEWSTYKSASLIFLAPTLFHRGGALDLVISLTHWLTHSLRNLLQLSVSTSIPTWWSQMTSKWSQMISKGSQMSFLPLGVKIGYSPTQRFVVKTSWYVGINSSLGHAVRLSGFSFSLPVARMWPRFSNQSKEGPLFQQNTQAIKNNIFKETQD